MVIPEVPVVTPRSSAPSRAGQSELEQLARQAGMHTLWEAGITRVLAGQASLHELLDNVSPPIPDASAAQAAIDQLLGAVAIEAGRPTAAAPSARALGAPLEVVPMRPASTGARRVLVVHEDGDARRSLRQALEALGLAVIEAADGDAALAYARKLRPDAIVTEIGTPRLDGLGLLQGVRAEPNAPQVFIYTEQSDATLLAWSRELGAVDACTTAIDPSVFASRVRDFLSARVAVRQAS